jgi:3',5'-nucleoside bisphosphate phosphatase
MLPSPWMNADLHCHSCVSDGTLSPEELAARAKANGVELWSLTDHDEIGGQQRARDAALALGLPYLTGTEISVSFAGITVHIVGLGFDAGDAALRAGLAAANVRWRWPTAWPGPAFPAASRAHSSTSATPI